MELLHIRYFIAAAEKMHFALAAESLGISQPSLSHGIQMLEQELGVKLFDRSNKRRISLTESGRAFLPAARNAIQQLSLARRCAEEAEAGASGHLSIGALASALARKEFLAALADMRRKYPKVELEIIDEHSSGLSRRIREHSIDLAICRFDPQLFEDETLVCRKLFDDELLAVMPRSHALAKRRSLKVADLAEEKIIMVPQKTSPAFYESIRALCREQGHFQLKIAGECSNFYTAQHLLLAGFGVTFLPSSHEGLFPEALAYRRFSDCSPRSSVYAVFGDLPGSAPLHTFLGLLTKHFQQDEKSVTI